jgi:hypothetical protein
MGHEISCQDFLMSTSDPYPLDFIGLIKAMGERIQGDAHWIVKLAFHPDWKSLFIKNYGARR